MSLKIVHTENAPAAVGPYSQAVIHGNTMYISGQIPINPKTGELVLGDITVQTKQCLENLKAIVTAAGATFNDVIKVNVFITDMTQFAVVNKVYAEYFTDHKPARACVEVSCLPKNVDIEIEMIVAV